MRIANFLVADLEAGKGCNVTHDRGATEAIGRAGVDDSGGVGLDPDACCGSQRQGRYAGAGVEQDANLHAIDESHARQTRLVRGELVQINDGVRCRGVGGPIREWAVAAVLGLDQPDYPLAEVVFDVGDVQDILAENADAAGPDLAAAHHELDVVQGDAGEREVLDPGERRAGNAAADAADVETEWRGAQYAVGGTAVEQQLHIDTVHLRIYQRSQIRHGDRKFRHPRELAAAGEHRKRGHRHCDHGDDELTWRHGDKAAWR